MKFSLVSVLLLTASVASAATVNNDELANRILKRASRSLKGSSSYVAPSYASSAASYVPPSPPSSSSSYVPPSSTLLSALDDFLFFWQFGAGSIGNEMLNTIMFTMDYITPSFDYVMNTVYGRGFRLNETYRYYVQMYMTDDQIADHNHLLKIFKEQFNSDYDLYLKSGMDDLYGVPFEEAPPLSQNAMDYLGRTIPANFPPAQQYTQQQLASGVASVLQGFRSQNPSNVYYVPQTVPVAVQAPSQPLIPITLDVSEKPPPSSVWKQDPNGDWFYITYVKNEKGALPSGGFLLRDDLRQPPGPPPFGSYVYQPSSAEPRPPPPPGSYQASSGQYRPPPSESYQPSSGQPQPPPQIRPPSGSYQSPGAAQPRHAGSQSSIYSQPSEQGRVETRVSIEYPYQDYVVSSPQFPPLASSGENFQKSQQPSRQSGPQGSGQSNVEFLPQIQNDQSSYVSFTPSDAGPLHPALPKTYVPDSSANFQQNVTARSNEVVNLEGIPESFIDREPTHTPPQPYSLPKSRKKRLADLYQSDLPPKIFFCPPENTKLLLCAGDIALDVLVLKPMLYVLSWFV